MNQHLKPNPLLQGLTKPRIVIMRSLPGLGDWLCWMPALRALRAAFPDAEIALIGLPGTEGFVSRFHTYIDKILPFPGFPGIPETTFDAARLRTFLEHVQALKFDLALQMHGNGSCTNGFILQLGARLNAGFYPSNGRCPDRHFLPYPEGDSEVWRHLRLLEFLGIPLQGVQLEFPLLEQDWQDWQAIASTQPLSANYVCIHPGASVAARRWHPAYFAHIADALAVCGWQIVLTGTADERCLTEAVAAAMRFPALNLAGSTSLGALAVLLLRAQLLICNDTGVSHLADALRTKSVVIFSTSDVHRWAPLNRQLHRVVQARNVQTGSSDRSNSTLQLASSPGIAQVLAEAMDLLVQEYAYVS